MSGRISADDVRKDKRSVDEVMLDLLPIASEFARPPLSNFRVGAIALGSSGSLYLGANLELPDNALNQTVHAEQSAIANAYGHGERGITAITVTAAPCGHCRQFLNEISGASDINVVVKGQPSRKLSELLPASFGPQDLGMPNGMFGSNATKLSVKSNDALMSAALEAAARAYAPYTKALAGCAVQTTSGAIYSGSYLENAAFNPGLPPLQSALVNLIFAGEDLGAITRVALVELRDASISHRYGTAAGLRAIAPEAQLDVTLSERDGA